MAVHAWEKSDVRSKVSAWRILNFATLLVSAAALFLALKKPAPVAQPQAPAMLSANAQSFQAKLDQLEQAQTQGHSGAEIHLTGEEVAAAFAQNSGSIPSTPQVQRASTGSSVDLAAPVASGVVDASSLGEPVVTFQGDQVIGQFAADLGGKKVYITVAGHLGAKDGYVTFDPTEFKFGDLNIPVSLVNEALQKKMLEQRDRLKLPEFISDVRVQNGELIIRQK